MASTMRLRLFNRIANPAVRAAVRWMPRGRPARAVALLSYQGRTSGRSFTLPVEYAEDTDGGYVIVPGEPEHKTWWRNFRTAMPVRLLVTGQEIGARAELIDDVKERRDALAVYFRRFPTAARMQGLTRRADGELEPRRLGELAARTVVVHVTPQP